MENKKRLFVDLDGTLARFHDEANYLERMYEPNFFINLKPFQNAVDGLRDFIKKNPDVDVNILSTAINSQSVLDKRAWVKKHIPELDGKVYTPAIGERKSWVVPGGIKHTDYLLDDYNKNLEEWQSAGGNSIKCINNINNLGLNGAKWTGKSIDISLSSEKISEMLSQAISPELTLKFYSPVFPRMFEYDEYGGLEYESCELSPRDAVWYKDEIRKKYFDYEASTENEQGWMEWYNDENPEVERKVISLFGDFEVIKGSLYFVLEAKLKEPLTELEIKDLKGYITGQQGDGIGESLEQQEIKIDDGELYVSLWRHSKDYFIMTEDEFNMREQQQSQDFGLNMG